MANKTYKSKYDVSGAIADYAQTAGEGFNYDPTTDAAYQAYTKEYARLGEKARQNVLGDASALTGGYASSYAVSAAAQAQNDYNRQLTAVIPELENAAYARWSDQLNNQYNYAGLLMNADAAGYDRWAENRAFDYQKARDAVADAQWEKEFALAKAKGSGSGGGSGGGSRSGSKSSGSNSNGNGKKKDPTAPASYNTPTTSYNAKTGETKQVTANEYATLDRVIYTTLMKRGSTQNDRIKMLNTIQKAEKSGKITSKEAKQLIAKHHLG